jgi:hypothetical protein
MTDMPRLSASSLRDPAINGFLTPEGRLPPFAQRRLDDLIARNKQDDLTAAERRELKEMLDYVDRKNVEILKRMSQKLRRQTRSK